MTGDIATWNQDKNAEMDPNQAYTNYTREGDGWRREAYIEVFDEEGSISLAQNIEISIHGGFSTIYPQKGFNLLTPYGVEKEEYIFKFPGGEEYSSLMLRPGGLRDWKKTQFRDVLNHELVEDRNITVLNGIPCQVFLDGEYWGLYNLQERIDNGLIAKEFGVDIDNLIVTKTDLVVEGNDEDAGYINDFHTDTADIVTMKTYKDYLAIYKRDKVYLLTGSNPTDFAITLFADKGSIARNAIVNVDNKQYFLSNGIYALEQVGELNQIRLGSEISQNIKEEFNRFDESRLDDTFVLHYQNKHQVWFFFPYLDNENFSVIWINDYYNKAWFKRVLPQKITSACTFNSHIFTADVDGKIYREDFGTSFNGEAIKFMWKSPFLALGNVLHRKLVDEFYFVLDDIHDNKFKFSLFKDYDSEYKDDVEYYIYKLKLMW